MKEDILEQLVDDWLQARGYFTRHNLKFRPRADHPDFNRRQDSVHSDIDILGVNPLVEPPEGVVAVSCKSWQAGFNVRAKPEEIEKDKIRSGRAAWKGFRELVQPKWSEAFIKAIEQATGSRRFVYVTAVTLLRGDRSAWEKHDRFCSAIQGNPLRVITLKEIAKEVASGLTTTVASSHLGRTLQLFKAAGVALDT